MFRGKSNHKLLRRRHLEKDTSGRMREGYIWEDARRVYLGGCECCDGSPCIAFFVLNRIEKAVVRMVVYACVNN